MAQNAPGEAPAQSPPDAAFELVQADTLRFFPEIVTELGGDPDAIMAAVGIAPATLRQPVPRLGYRAMIDLLEQAAATLKRPDFGLYMATRQGGGRVFGPIGEVMRNSRTFRESIEYAASHIQAVSLAASIRIEQDRESRRMLIGFDILLDNIPNKSQMIEQVLLLAHHNALEITNGRARMREVWFRHRPLSSLRTYRDHFGCDVRFDQAMDGMVFTQDDMDAAIVTRDARHYEQATVFIDTNFPAASPPLHARVRGLIMNQLGVSDCKLDGIADALCLHPRTLNRRLRHERRSFEDIKTEVRRDRARYYIEQTNVPFSFICERVGYSETSAFSRACLRWFGAPPSAMRSRVRGRRTSAMALQA